MAEKKTKKESQLDIIARNMVAMHKDVLATKETVRQIQKDMATKEDLHALEVKLIEDTGAIAGVDQKQNRSLVQRVSRLEKEVFHKTT